MRKSSSYSLTSCADLSDEQPLRSKVSRSAPSGQSSLHVSTGRVDPAQTAPANPLLPSLKKSSSWPQKSATAAKASGLTSGNQRYSCM